MKKFIAILIALVICFSCAVTALADVLPPVFIGYYMVVVNPEGTTPLCIDENDNFVADKSFDALPAGYVRDIGEKPQTVTQDSEGFTYIRVTCENKDGDYRPTWIKEKDVVLYDEEEYQNYLSQKTEVNETENGIFTRLYNGLIDAIKDLINSIKELIHSIKAYIPALYN